MSACEQVAKTQQDTLLITDLLPQTHAISTGPQVPRLLPKQVCYQTISHHPLPDLVLAHGAFWDLAEQALG